ncbi:hypothetical protein CN918_28330 [Priestia megaterium]|nr:hypothetical protein CN918_28330 [Priestia megaterium]
MLKSVKILTCARINPEEMLQRKQCPSFVEAESLPRFINHGIETFVKLLEYAYLLAYKQYKKLTPGDYKVIGHDEETMYVAIKEGNKQDIVCLMPTDESNGIVSRYSPLTDKELFEGLEKEFIKMRQEDPLERRSYKEGLREFLKKK